MVAFAVDSNGGRWEAKKGSLGGYLAYIYTPKRNLSSCSMGHVRPLSPKIGHGIGQGSIRGAVATSAHGGLQKQSRKMSHVDGATGGNGNEATVS